MMMHFFNRNWAGASGGRWAEPGSYTNWAGAGLQQPWFAGSGDDAALQDTRMKEGSARASPVAAPMPKSVSFLEKIGTGRMSDGV